MYSYYSYIDSCEQLGSSWAVSEDVLLKIEKFVSHMYVYNEPNFLNDLRYKRHCSEDGKITADLLPPYIPPTHYEQITKPEFGDCAWSAAPSCHHQTITMVGALRGQTKVLK